MRGQYVECLCNCALEVGGCQPSAAPENVDALEYENCDVNSTVAEPEA